MQPKTCHPLHQGAFGRHERHSASPTMAERGVVGEGRVVMYGQEETQYKVRFRILVQRAKVYHTSRQPGCGYPG